ncbi:hypothetical protein BD309DRAFT_815232, partial [Dichomitus squalens]
TAASLTDSGPGCPLPLSEFADPESHRNLAALPDPHRFYSSPTTSRGEDAERA